VVSVEYLRNLYKFSEYFQRRVFFLFISTNALIINLLIIINERI
jgi:hypothetical protein